MSENTFKTAEQMPMTWNTFRATANRECETERHNGLGVPATTFQMVWRKDQRNLAQSVVMFGYFTCQDCATQMYEIWMESQQ